MVDIVELASKELENTTKMEGKPVPKPLMSRGDLDSCEDDEEFYDETLSERLWGLTEMFPEGLRSFTSKFTSFTIRSTKWAYNAGRVAVWVAASSATILALPIMFETERAQMEEQQLAQQRHMLLGPNAALTGPGMMPAPQVVPPAKR